jgi:hypothetical protein
MQTLEIKLSEAQKKVIRNARINGNVGIVAGSLGVLGSWSAGKRNLFDLAMHFIVTGATAQMISGFFYPVNPEKMLDFDKQSLGSLQNQAEYEGFIWGYDFVYFVNGEIKQGKNKEFGFKNAFPLPAKIRIINSIAVAIPLEGAFQYPEARKYFE